MTTSSSRREFIGIAAGAGAAIGLGGATSATAAASRRASQDIPGRLKILVLGGTGQTGPHFVSKALAHGHDVTLFNRGNRSDELFPGVECIVGDRMAEGGLDALQKEIDAGRKWDVVFDIWPHIPKVVEATAELLKNNTKRYMYVSSVSVYVDSSQPNQDENAEVGAAPDADDMEFDFSLFGPFKAECENRVRRIYPGPRHTVFRPGLIVGPRDFSFRGGYWPVRVRDGGEVLAPGDGETRIQIIDARDLVAFQLLAMEQNVAGTFNVTGPHPHNPLTMKRYLETCERVSESDAEFTWAPAEFLSAHGVQPWMNMPCWLPAEGEYAGFGTRSIAKAVAAGLTFRPLSETVEDTLTWFDGLSEEGRQGVRQRAGVPAEREKEVLAAFHEWMREQDDGDDNAIGAAEVASDGVIV